MVVSNIQYVDDTVLQSSLSAIVHFPRAEIALNVLTKVMDDIQ